MLTKYFFDPSETDSTDSIDLLCDGNEIFPQLLSRIEEAKERLALEIYMFASDKSGKKVRDAFVHAAKRGVQVRIIFDSLGSLPNRPNFWSPLKKAGGEVLEYHPVIQWRDRFNLHRRDHRKMLLSDDSAIISGLNITEEYEKPIEKGGFHDLAIEVEGRVVQSAWKLFEQTWKKEVEHDSTRIGWEPTGEGATQIIGNNHILDRWRLRRSLLYAMSQAEKSVHLMNPYFLPASDVLTLFRKLIKKGCEVTVILPESSDIMAVNLASQIVEQRFLRRNVRIFRFKGKLHAKAILVDGRFSSIGSYNFDYQSLFRNLEVVANTISGKVAKRLNEVFIQDQKRSIVATLDDWKRMSWWEKLGARLLYRLRRFL